MPHPVGVALGQVVVDRDDVDALAGQGVQISRQGADERLALAGLHLGDRSIVDRHPTEHLNVVMPLADRASGRLAGQRERLDEQVVERLAAPRPESQQSPALAKLVVGLGFQGRLERLDGADRGRRSPGASGLEGRGRSRGSLPPDWSPSGSPSHVLASRQCRSVNRSVRAGVLADEPRRVASPDPMGRRSAAMSRWVSPIGCEPGGFRAEFKPAAPDGSRRSAESSTNRGTAATSRPTTARRSAPSRSRHPS